MAEYRHLGHRERVRERFDRYGAEVFESYELLEMLLFYSIPMRDTRALARGLVDKFGSLSAVLAAGADELKATDGVGDSTAELILATRELLDSAKVIHGAGLAPAPVDFHSLGAILTEYFLDIDESLAVVVSLDNSLRVIAIDRAYKLPFYSGAVQPKGFLDPAIERHASLAVIAFNHPRGPAFPLPNELETARLLSESFANAGIPLAEQYLILKGEYRGIMNRTGEKGCEARLPRRAEDGGIEGLDKPPSSPTANNNIKEILSRLTVYLKGDLSSDIESISSAYGSACAMLSADKLQLDRLCKSPKLTFMIRLLSAIFAACYTEALAVGRVSSRDALERYLQGLFFGKSYEELYVISFDGKMRYIATDKISEGTVADTQLVPRRILDRVFSRGGRAVALAHNHPQGDTTPSVQDIESNSCFRRLLEDYGVDFLGHFIVADGSVGVIE